MKFGEIRKPLMIFCLSASVAIHSGAFWVIYSHPLTLKREDTTVLMKSAPSPAILSKDNADLLVEKMERALEESLNKVVAVAHFQKQTHDLAKQDPIESDPLETDSEVPTHTPIAAVPQAREEDIVRAESYPEQIAASMPPLFDPELQNTLADLALDTKLEEEKLTYVAECPLSTNLNEFDLPTSQIAPLMEDDYTMTADQFSPDALPATQLEELTPHLTFSLKNLQIAQDESIETSTEALLSAQPQESSSPQLILPNSVDYLRSQWLKRNIAETTLPDLDYYGFDKVSQNLKWQEDLDAEVTLIADPNSNKYIFSLTIHPDFEMDCKNMRQNFYFVIDRSSSVEKHKFSRFKLAVQRSLAALCDGDTFNIYFFDTKVVKLSEKNLAVTPRTIQMAEDFLEESPEKNRYGATESFRSLETLLPQQMDPNELHSIILISDGNSLQSPQKQKKELKSWAEKHDRNVNFYTAAAGKGNNLILLDLFSYTTAGKLLYSDTNAGFPRKMVHLIKNLHNPIVKNINIEVTPSASNAQVQLYPQNQFLPPMFAGQPYVITGTVDELCDLTFFIQGKNHDKFINVRKRISLKDAPTGGRSLEKLWADTQAKICYDHFLEQGKNIYLKEAAQIVAPYHGDIASQ